ncbi:MAG: hypothetical protein ACJAY5_000768 [Actinomycetes bacterium]|jgi:hypothetical protein
MEHSHRVIIGQPEAGAREPEGRIGGGCSHLVWTPQRATRRSESSTGREVDEDSAQPSRGKSKLARNSGSLQL